MVTLMAHRLVQTSLLLVWSLGIVIVVAEKDLLTTITKEYTLTGLAHFAGEQDVVVPYQVDEQGQLLTYDIGRETRRYKRGRSRPQQVQTRCFRLVAFKENFHMCVLPNVDLLSPDIVVETIQRNGKIKTDRPRSDCYWTGILQSHPNSSVAISTCDGMAGLLRTADTELLIEPLVPEMRKKANVSRGIPHIIKRRPLDTQGSWQSSMDGPSSDDIICTVGERRRQSNFSAKPRSRSTRSSYPVVADPYIEVMVVVDHHMYKSYDSNSHQTELLVLSLMNIVSLLYSEEPHGVGVKIMVVELKILKDARSGLNISHDIILGFDQFCQWQRRHQVPAGSPGHYDLAVLLTGRDLCYQKGGDCNSKVAGKANIGDVCRPNRSCVIAEDMGFVTPFTVAHEIGHTLSMEHDGLQHSPVAAKCNSDDGFVMSQVVPNGPRTFLWSDCSRQFLQDFLRKPDASCLADKPGTAKQLTVPGAEPGQSYSADIQCQVSVPGSRRACSREQDNDVMRALSISDTWTVCEFLVCFTNQCLITSNSAADFTLCDVDDDNKVCLRGHCVDKPKPRNGGWSQYYPKGPCPRSCGGGVLVEMRYCNNPNPRFGGRNCIGSNVRQRLCNEQPCSSARENPRDAECAKMNGFAGSGNCQPGGKRAVRSHWVSYNSDVPGKECLLHCQMKETGCIHSDHTIVADGMPCTNNGSFRCVYGNCMAVGCDGTIGSNKVVDGCNICGGDNSTCKEITKIFNGTLNRKGYYLVKKFDVGNFRIHIEELSASDATSLSLRDSDGNYLLDSHTTNKDWPEWDYNGTLIVYRQVAGQPEVITIANPLTRPLQLWVHFVVGHGPNPGIRYTFTRNKTRVVDNFHWSLLPEWSGCSVTCGSGIRVRNYHCYRKQRGVPVKEKFCDHTPKPPHQVMTCRKSSCPTTDWLVGMWSMCSADCTLQSRSVSCHEYVDDKPRRQIANTQCTNATKPPNERECDAAHCHECKDNLIACSMVSGLPTFPDLCNTTTLNSVCCKSCRSVLS